MLYATLVLSAALLSATLLAARRMSATTVSSSLAGLAVLLLCLMVFWPVLVQAALLSAAVLVWRAAGWGPGRLAALSVVATAVPYGVAGWAAADKYRETVRLREKYRFEPLDGRLPLLAARAEPAAFDHARLAAVEDGVEEAGHTARAFRLRFLHEGAVKLFSDSPGFGPSRMVPMTERGMQFGLHDDPPPAQPADAGGDYWRPGESESAPAGPVAGDKALADLHAGGVLDFINPRGFGLVKDNRRVAGFQAHGFSAVPKSPQVVVARLELVSLLLHDAPAVYVSDKLPRMDELKGAPTRPLDPFEEQGLATLRKGDELYVRGDRMFGAVRSAKQCIDCHGGSRGELLGAFSYRLKAVGR